MHSLNISQQKVLLIVSAIFVFLIACVITICHTNLFSRKITHLTSQQIYLKAIARNPKNALGYNNLATTLSPNDTIMLLDGTQMTKQELCPKAITLDPKLTEAYNNLIFTVSQRAQSRHLMAPEDISRALS